MWEKKLEAEAVKFLWKRKRKHFDEKDWERKRIWKRLILSVELEVEAKNSNAEKAEANSEA